MPGCHTKSRRRVRLLLLMYWAVWTVDSPLAAVHVSEHWSAAIPLKMAINATAMHPHVFWFF